MTRPAKNDAPEVSELSEATVMYGETARIGSRVKHFGQRFTGCATATVTGFREQDGWVKVLVDHDNPESAHNFPAWDWDRTELAPDV